MGALESRTGIKHFIFLGSSSFALEALWGLSGIRIRHLRTWAGGWTRGLCKLNDSINFIFAVKMLKELCVPAVLGVTLCRECLQHWLSNNSHKELGTEEFLGHSQGIGTEEWSLGEQMCSEQGRKFRSCGAPGKTEQWIRKECKFPVFTFG